MLYAKTEDVEPTASDDVWTGGGNDSRVVVLTRPGLGGLRGKSAVRITRAGARGSPWNFGLSRR